MYIIRGWFGVGCFLSAAEWNVKAGWAIRLQLGNHSTPVIHLCNERRCKVRKLRTVPCTCACSNIRINIPAIRLSNPELRQQKAWYTLHWRVVTIKSVLIRLLSLCLSFNSKSLSLSLCVFLLIPPFSLFLFLLRSHIHDIVGQV